MNNPLQKSTNIPIPQGTAPISSLQKSQHLKMLVVILLVFVAIIGVLALFGLMSKNNNGQNQSPISKIPSVTTGPTIDYKNVVQVKGNSMEPDFKNNEYYLVDRTFYESSPVQRADVVLFERNNGQSARPVEYIKRIVGLPNESIKISGGKIYISDTLLSEDYLSPNTTTNLLTGGIFKEGVAIIIPKDEYFVLGDNRARSSDSREYGFISKKDILGKIGLRLPNYVPPTASPQEKMLNEKYDLLDTITQKIEILNNVKFCQSLPSFQNPELICVINRERSCSVAEMNNDQLKKINQLTEQAINDCVQYQQKLNQK